MYDINVLSATNGEDYLRGLNEINKEILDLRSNKEITAEDERRLKRQIKTLTSPKIAKATQSINKSFAKSRELIRNSVPPSYRGEAARQLFYDVDDDIQELIEEGATKKEIKDLYRTRTNEIIDRINSERREQAVNKVSPGTTPGDEEDISDGDLLEEFGYSEDQIKSEAQSRGVTEKDVLDTLRKHRDKSTTNRDSDDKGASADILRDEGVVKDDRGNHLAYTDSRGFPTGGHGHLLTEEEKAKYPVGSVIPQSVVEAWKDQDLAEADEDVSAIFGDVQNPEVQSILKNMAFNLGRTKLNKFTRLKNAIKNEDYAKAAQSMKESVWYRQVGDRSKRLVARMERLS